VVFYGELVRIDCYAFDELAEEQPFQLGRGI
jgi:hypothetical protein